ncbi:MAG: hydrolase [Oscillospiraceae bacterium]|nr:hydrolase [Oscillospiraceae bacterium]
MNFDNIPEIYGTLRKGFLQVPEEINKVSGIRIFGKLIKSVAFTTDVAIIRNINSDAIIAVYPFTPQPVITQSIIEASEVPVFCGIGGSITSEIDRVLRLATYTEFQGAIGVVVNTAISNKIVSELSKRVDIPVVVTVVSGDENLEARVNSGASILNVSAADKTPFVVDKIKKISKDIIVMATGGPSSQSIIDTVNAGANAITWTPPTGAQLLKTIMTEQRLKLPKKSDI